MTTPGGTRVVLVAAVADNGVIGADGGIPWHLPGDLAHFKRTTIGHTLLMGRTTYDSIGRPLPGRTTIVLTRTSDWAADGVLVARSLPEAFAAADRLPGELMVVGGAQVYAEALAYADEQVLTQVPLTPGGDVLYPRFDRESWVEVARERFPDFEVVRLVRGYSADS